MKKRKGLNVVHNIAGWVIVAQLYDTRIYAQDENAIVLNSGTWRSNHTKNCINDLLPNEYKLYQKDFIWYLATPLGVVLFEDGMEIPVGGENV